MLWKVWLLSLVIAIVHIIFNPKAMAIVGIAITKKKDKGKKQRNYTKFETKKIKRYNLTNSKEEKKKKIR